MSNHANISFDGKLVNTSLILTRIIIIIIIIIIEFIWLMRLYIALGADIVVKIFDIKEIQNVIQYI